jgi:hypothetical protein
MSFGQYFVQSQVGYSIVVLYYGTTVLSLDGRGVERVRSYDEMELARGGGAGGVDREDSLLWWMEAVVEDCQ